MEYLSDKLQQQSRRMALSYMQEAQITAGLLAMKQETSDKHRHRSPSPALNNNNNNNNNNSSNNNNNSSSSSSSSSNNNNNSGSNAASMFSNQALAAAAAAASLSSMLTPQQIIAAQCQALLATGQFPVSLANTSLYGHQLFGAWAPPSASSPPLQQAVGPVSPVLSVKSTGPSCNSSHAVVGSKKSVVGSGHKKKMAKLNSSAASVKSETSLESVASPPSSVSPESTKDPRDKVFTCGVCSRSFGYKHVLQNHERTHTGEKPFKCPECHKRFTRDHHLKTHMRLHTGEKPYHCSHCDRQFVQVANLRRHLRVHTGERPYQCQVCAAKFSDSNQLKAHLLIHKDEKPFKCEHCQMRFRRRHHLNHHKCSALPSSLVSAELRHEPMISSSSSPVALNLTSLPEQTEPEDLSMPSSRHHYQARPQSHSSGGGSPMSHSPNSDCNDEDEDEVDLSRASPSSLFALDARRVR